MKWEKYGKQMSYTTSFFLLSLFPGKSSEKLLFFSLDNHDKGEMAQPAGREKGNG